MDRKSLVRRRYHLNQKSFQAAWWAPGKYTKSYCKRPSPKMARTLSAIPPVRRRDFSKTNRPGVDRLGPSGIAGEWQNAIDDYVRASARPHTTRSSRQDPPSQDYLRSISIDRGSVMPNRYWGNSLVTVSEGNEEGD